VEEVHLSNEAGGFFMLAASASVAEGFKKFASHEPMESGQK
jgi:hypothetical protein